MNFQALNSQPVVSAQWLLEHLNNANVAIADCRFSLQNPALGQQQYEASHIPGAYYLDLNQDLSGPVQQHGGRHPLPNPEALAAKLAVMGVNSKSYSNEPTLVVAYDDSRFAYAARLWWLLNYLGHERVAVLDGGYSGWQANGYPVTLDSPKSQPGNFTLHVHPELAVDIEAVKAKKDLPGVVLVDSRETARYRGEHEPIDPIAGHIPSAVNYPWQDVTDDQGFCYPLAQQLQRWESLQAAPEILVYCGSGVTACVNLLSMAIANLPIGILYAGGWSDWCSYLVSDQVQTQQ
jgi:thiosulfate/3-mercaptopyruvate sulfurtransferase